MTHLIVPGEIDPRFQKQSEAVMEACVKALTPEGVSSGAVLHGLTCALVGVTRSAYPRAEWRAIADGVHKGMRKALEDYR